MTLNQILTSFADMTQDPVVVGYRTAGDDRPRVAWINHAFRRQFGYSFADLEGQSVFELLDPEHRRDLVPKITARLKHDVDSYVYETEFVRKDGSKFWGSISGAFLPRDSSGGRYSYAVIHDLSVLKERERRAEATVRENQLLLQQADAVRERLLVAIDNIDAPLAIWDRDWKMVVSNQTFCPTLLGRDGRLPPGTSVEDFLQEAAYAGKFVDALGQEEEWKKRSLEALKSGSINDITRYSDGRIFRAVSKQGKNGDTVIFNSDITDFTEQRRELENKNVQLELSRAEADMRALHDDLTALGNRRFIGEGLRELLSDRERLGGEITSIAIDLDRFKPINDTLGHAAGDFVLVSVAGRLKGVIDPGDLVARVGGDEFIILRHMTDEAQTPEDLGRRIVDEMSKPFRFEDAELRLGASVGVAQTPLSGEDDLLTNADIALYKAKSSGRGRVATFDERDLAEMLAAKELSDALLDAIEKSAFVPYFQPQIDVVTGQIVGVEALARWPHPERGVLAPAAFLGVAADIGALEMIDKVIFDKALEACGNAFDGPTAPILSFNVSEERFLASTLIDAARSARSYVGGISIELLETIFFEDQNDAFNLQLDTLRDIGVSIEIDDFGSGRASIVALEQVAPDRLKIDRRLVSAVAETDRSAKLVKAIVDIGHALGIGVTAEGVETSEQAARLAELGCDRLQGYLYGRPMPLAALLDKMETSSVAKRRA